MMFKKVPIGIENYIEANQSFYVDKTLIIKDIIEYHLGRSILITRPRRFGKSLTVSMLDYFFTNQGNYRNEFADKKILMDPKYESFLNQYPVIRLNMKNVCQANSDEMLKAATETISNLFRNHKDAMDNPGLFKYEVEKYLRIANHETTDPSDYTDSIYFLSELLRKKYNQKVIILIDEYDTPLENANQNGFYQDVVVFFKTLYSTSLKGNDNLLFSLTTGVLQIAKESIFSELNNLDVYSVIDEGFGQYFGFTEDEVCRIFSHFNIRADIEEIKNWYGGYFCGETYLFNPWSILNYVQKEILECYWANTGSNQTVSALIRHLPNGMSDLNDFINNANLSLPINTYISYKDLSYTREVVSSILVQGGYLVARRIGKSKLFHVRIPNEEIREVFFTEIMERNNIRVESDLVTKLRDALLNGDATAISSLLQEFVLSAFSYYELTKEKDYQILVVTLLAVLFDKYVVKSEVNNAKGRCDVMLLPKNNALPGMIIELKKYKGQLGKKRLEAKCHEAIQQIKSKEYYEELLRFNVSSCLLYGFVFDDRNSEIKMEEIHK